MFYEVRARLLFTKQDEAVDFYHDCELALAKTDVINPGHENMETPIIQLINNNHDQDPSQPCELMSTHIKLPEQ